MHIPRPQPRQDASDLLPLPTPRLVLRRFRPDDVSTLLAYRSDPAVSRFQGWDDVGEVGLRRFVDEMAQVPEIRPGSWFQIALASRANGRHLGDLGILPDDVGTITLGYSLARHAQGKGLASEAVTALLDALFRHHAVHRVVASVDSRNEASIRLLERLAFRRESHQLESYLWQGQWASEYGYAVLAREWLERRQGPG